ncbi:MFS transporter [Acetobacterium paludosum]|uniref:MFS transporter n=1 Tax=Acetobacterium paludosum TaxID=52693 RepID=A0A923HV35_9FIRM|nr:MFS transporter [Acetobacterium paludosum]MBC3889103.1 MFS transporter [Acetobacterium paludosum]
MAQKNSTLSAVAILSLFFLTMGVGTITPALNSIMQAFPNLSVSTIYLTSTLPSLLCIPATLIAGAIAGNKVKFKTLSIIGILLFLIGGIAPAFANDFTVILIERAVFGIGLGIMSPIGNALIIGLYDDNPRAKMMGLGTILMNVGGVILQFAGGLLAGISWNYAFYAHAFGIISLLLVIFFLPEPNKIEQPIGVTKQKVKIKSSVWLISILFGCVMLLDYPLLMGMSTFLANHNLGGPAVAAIVLSFFTVGGIIAGVIFSNIFKIAKRFTISFGLFAFTLGYVLVLFTGNIIMVTIGTALVGIGFSTLFPAVMMIIGMVSEPQAVPICVSIVLAIMNAFAFITTYWIALIGSITGNAIEGPMFAAMIMATVAGAIFLFIDPFPKTGNMPQPQDE